MAHGDVLLARDLAHAPSRFGFVTGGRGLIWVAVIALLGLAALPLDLPIARWFHDGHCPAEILRWLSFAETYAHGFGVACILLTVFVLDAGRRRLMPRALAIALGAGVTANLLKLSVVRARPHEFNLGGDYSVLDTFGQWLPLHHVVSGDRSFPSGHMATAVGLTAALVWLLPRGRYLFPLFAILAGCQRMSSGSHYLSDVVWGAAVGTLAMALFLPGGLFTVAFDRLETYLASRGDRLEASPSDTDGKRAA